MGVRSSQFIRRPDGSFVRVTEGEGKSIRCFYCKKETEPELKVEVDPFKTAYVCSECFKKKDLHGPQEPRRRPSHHYDFSNET